MDGRRLQAALRHEMLATELIRANKDMRLQSRPEDLSKSQTSAAHSEAYSSDRADKTLMTLGERVEFDQLLIDFEQLVQRNADLEARLDEREALVLVPWPDPDPQRKALNPRFSVGRIPHEARPV